MPQQPYGSSQNFYGMAPYNDPTSQQDFKHGGSPVTPLPLGVAIAQLPGQYMRVLLRPSSRVFAEEMGKATWSIVFVQLIAWTIIAAVLGYLGNSIEPLPTSDSALSPSTMQILADIRFANSYGLLVLTPALFFGWTGLMFLLAKAFGGEGRFLAQCYTTLLFQVPLGILGSILSVIPFAGWLGIVLFIYSLVLQVYATMGVHGLSGGKATATLAILLAILVVVLCPLTFAFVLLVSLSQLH
jgi:hypothetical protein